ncbi:hypothetical protein E3J61_03195 [Candidatus Dependentiae bacterium]|nr:MAG: hypothetical protein E3J61_03195 [Candidatus Dependentiae bacterium]
MKRVRILIVQLICSQIFINVSVHAMQDKPALSWYEKAGKAGAKVVGALGGVKVGSYLGASADERLIGQEELESDEEELQKEKEELAKEEEEQREEMEELIKEEEELLEEEELDMGDVTISSQSIEDVATRLEKFNKSFETIKLESGDHHPFTEKKIKKMIQKAVIKKIKLGRKVGGLAGALAGYHLGSHAATRALAWRHGVSYRVEKVSHFYDLNVDQYGPLLFAAEKKDKAAIMKEMAAIFSKRFGSNWQQKIMDSFKFEDYLFYLLNKRIKKRSELTDQEMEDIRIIEFGAALEDLYMNTAPSRKNEYIIKSALAMYVFLGFVKR